MVSRTVSVIFILSIGALSAAQFSGGNLVLVQVGKGLTPPGPPAARVTLRQLSTEGADTGYAVILPFDRTQGTNFTLGGAGITEGALARSADGASLYLAGYDAPENSSNPATASVSRVVARIAASGAVDLSTIFSDGFIAGNVRAATSDSDSRVWVSGTSGASNTGGIRAALVGASATTPVFTAGVGLNNVRAVNIFDLGAGPTLYCSSGSSPFIGIVKVGTSPLSLLTGQSATLLPGFPGSSTASGLSPYDFVFTDPSTLYIADDRATASGGIQKWTLNAGTWSLAYTLNQTAANGVRGLTASKSGAVVTLYGTTTMGVPNKIVTVTDNGPASPVLDLVAAAPNTVFRGIEFSPVAVAGTRTVSGKLIDTDFAGDWSQHPMTFELRAGSNIAFGPLTLSPTSTGTYALTLPNSLANGPYDACIKADHWLSRQVNVTVSGNITGLNVTLLPGDVDQDDAVSILDYSILSDYFDLDSSNQAWDTVGINGYRPRDADLDGDESVSILDYSSLSNNFDKTGECQ